jgi:hypothetical protein
VVLEIAGRGGWLFHLPNLSELGNPSLAFDWVEKLTWRPESPFDRERSFWSQKSMKFDPDLFHIADGVGKPEKKDEIKALVRQVRLSRIGNHGLGVGYARVLDLLLTVFHGQRVDVQRGDASFLAYDFRGGNGKEARTTANF